MKKTIICNVPMKENVDLSLYTSDDVSVPVSDRMVRYPVNALLEETLNQNDEINVLLLVKEDKYGHFKKNVKNFIDELNIVNEQYDAQIEIVEINTEFSQDKQVHQNLMSEIIDNISNGSHIISDITYGPKDLPIVIFAALGFAEKFLECEIDGIVYGQASFVDGHVVDTKICDMSPLYYLSSVSSSIHAEEPDKARKMLKSLLSL